MNIDNIVGFTAFGMVYILEYIFPFFNFPGWRLKHAFNNLALAVINSVLIFLIAYLFIFSVEYINQRFGGILAVFNNRLVIKVLAAVVLFDLWMYVWHRLNHEIPFLWRFHRVHHTDPAMDSTTALRFHPIELGFSYLLNIFVLGLLGLNFAFLIIYRTIMLPLVIFHHSNVALPEKWDRFFLKLIVMPSMHRVHHSQRIEETNSNYGTIFSFWDRIFGTFRQNADIRSIIFGIGAFKGPKWQQVLGLLAVPFSRVPRKRA